MVRGVRSLQDCRLTAIARATGDAGRPAESGAAMGSQSRSTFRITFWRSWLLAVAILAVPALVAAVGFTMSGQLAAATAVASGLVAPLSSRCQSVWRSAAAAGMWTLRGSAAATIGTCIAGWDQIRSVSRLPPPGYPFVWVKTADQRWARGVAH
jgi:hypothetical protein